jgi:hypothetical protein
MSAGYFNLWAQQEQPQDIENFHGTFPSYGKKFADLWCDYIGFGWHTEFRHFYWKSYVGIIWLILGEIIVSFKITP